MKISLKSMLPCTLVVPMVILAGCSGSSSNGRNAPGSFRALGTFSVLPSGGQVAEISAITPDGNTLIYTDSATQSIGFLNITDPANVSSIARLGVDGEPTSVAITPNGLYAIVVVADVNEARVIRLSDRSLVRTFNLGGQPDSIAISKDGKYALIAIENERPDEEQPLPSSPPGYLYRINLTGNVGAWVGTQINLTLPGSFRFPGDPEPEYVDINDRNEAAVTLQENNAVAIVTLSSGAVRYFNAGTTTHPADLTDDRPASINFTQTLTNARREPDGIGWTPRGNLITANEGDYDLDLGPGEFTGGRNFTIFSPSGSVIFDDNGQTEREVASAGRYDDRRSDAKGVEAENVKIAKIGGKAYAFIALERAQSLAVYRLDSESNPTFVQILPTGVEPEGVAFNAKRNLIVTSNEGDGSLSFFSP